MGGEPREKEVTRREAEVESFEPHVVEALLEERDDFFTGDRLKAMKPHPGQEHQHENDDHQCGNQAEDDALRESNFHESSTFLESTSRVRLDRETVGAESTGVHLSELRAKEQNLGRIINP